MEAKVTKADMQMDGWWTTPVAEWSAASDAVFKHWHQYDRSTPRLDDDVALSALAFGYGARSVFGEHKLWAELALLLKSDWRQAHAGKPSWAAVEKVVKQGWTAAANKDPIRGESMVADPLPMEPQVDTNVPGGRLDR